MIIGLRFPEIFTNPQELIVSPLSHSVSNFDLVYFDGELLFHNDCRPINVEYRFKDFSSVNEIVDFVVKNRHSTTKSPFKLIFKNLMKFGQDDDIDREIYESWQPQDNDQVIQKHFLTYLTESWGEMYAMAIIPCNEAILKIIRGCERLYNEKDFIEISKK